MSEGQHGDRRALEADSLAGPRLAKADAARPDLPYRFPPDAAAAELHERYAGLEPESMTGDTVTVAGRLVGRREMGKLIFGVLQDAGGRIQLFADASTLGERHADFADLDLGDWVGATGEVITTRKGELSVRVTDFTLLAKSLREMPEKFHGVHDVEVRHRQRYLDLIANPEARRTMQVRAATVRAFREVFWERGFIEVETPVLQLQPGGALARPFVTHHEALGIDMYLRIAHELPLKKLVVGGVEKVFELGRAFRNEGISTRYNPDFTMLEAYQAYADYTDVMTLVEEVIAEVAESAAGSRRLSYQGRPIDLAPPWRRVTFLEVIAETTGIEFSVDMEPDELRRRAAGLELDLDEDWDVGKLLAEVFDKRVEAELWDPTIVHDYPKSISPLARDHRDDPSLVERFEVVAAGWELANAFSELSDPIEQRARFEAQAARRARGDEEAHPVDEDYLQALEYGLPPTGGLGIGVDRVVMILADRASIREVILFPAMRPE